MVPELIRRTYESRRELAQVAMKDPFTLKPCSRVAFHRMKSSPRSSVTHADSR
jgi:hypothetical protein